MKVKYFRSKKKTHRFNANQKVWICVGFQNHLYVYYKWRSSGRYVSGVIDRYASCVGEIKEIEVDDAFARRIYGDLDFLADDAALPSQGSEQILHPMKRGFRFPKKQSILWAIGGGLFVLIVCKTFLELLLAL